MKRAVWLGGCLLGLAVVAESGVWAKGPAREKKDEEKVKITIEGKIQNGDTTQKFSDEYDNAEDLFRDLRRHLKKAGVEQEREERITIKRFRNPGPGMGDQEWQREMPQFEFRGMPNQPMPFDHRLEMGPRRSKQPWLGVSMQELDEDLAAALQVKEGVVVTQVMDKSPAMKAGLKAGDVITKIDKTIVDDPGVLREEVMDHKVGDTVTLTVVRDGKTLTVDVRLARHGEAEPAAESSDNWMGLSVEAGKEGLVVSEVEEDGPADRAGVMAGDRLVEMQKEAVKDVKTFEAAVAKLKGKSVMLLVERHDQRRFILIKEKNSDQR